MKRLPALFLPALLLGLLAGCIEFDEQTMSYRYDAATDTLRIFQDYRGIHAEKGPVTTEEREQFDSVLNGQRTFFFNNWITEFNREGVAETLAKLHDPAKLAEMKLPEGAQPKLEKFLKLLLEHVRVENGPFYLDARGQLCGVQYVTVTKFSAVLAAGNDYVPFFARSQAEEGEKSPEEKAVLLKFATKPKPFAQFDGNAMTVRYPVTAAEYEKEFGAAAEDPQSAERIRKAGLKVSFADDVVTFQFGKKSDQVSTLILPFKTNAYSPNLIELARAKHNVRETFDTKKAAQEFLLKGRATDAVKK
ncbi:MAG: hypothetical protein HY301_20725 [Verrucomicrobia bacterium]|nr:hypothetical protein [Verrucomicrobiota bacterium]